MDRHDPDLDSDPEPLESATKWGIPIEDSLYVYRHPLKIDDMKDGGLMFLGFTATGRALEVGIDRRHDGRPGLVIAHSRDMSPAYIALFDVGPAPRRRRKGDPNA